MGGVGVPGGLVLGLGVGQVLVGPAGVRLVAAALLAAERACQRDGIAPPAEFVELRKAFALAVAEVRSSAAGTPEVPHSPDVSSSVVFGSVLVNPLTTTQAAKLLRCSPRNVRALCRRGAFESARFERGAWLVERDEVAGRGDGHGRSVTSSRFREGIPPHEPGQAA